MSKEIWKVIPGYPSYEVSNFGRVRRGLHTIKSTCTYPGRLLAQTNSQYPAVNLCEYGKKHVHVAVHLLVARTFIGPCPKGKEVNHKDLNKHNPKLSNLEYVTPKQNMQHALLHGVRMDGENQGQATLTNAQVRKIRQLYATGKYMQKTLADKFGVHFGIVHLVVCNKTYRRA